MILTVAIPTYNRPDKVTNTILRLLPQLTLEVKILILDNCSSVVIKEYLINELGAEAVDRLEIIRNRINIGADANFQRCFELCTTPYLWMLGDDDKIEENAIGLIFSELDKYKEHDLIGINFKSNCCWVPRNSPITINSLGELVTKLDTFGNWLFISTSVYKTEEYLKHIKHQLWGTYSMASQLVPPMVAISNNKTFILSEKYIVTNIKAEEDDPGGKWSDFQLALGLSSLLEAPVGFKKNEYKLFGQKMEIHFNCIGPGIVLCTILRSVNYNIDLIDNYHLYIFNQLFFKTWEFRVQKFRQLFKYYIVKFLLQNKVCLKIVLKMFPKIKRKAERSSPFYLFKR